MCRETIRTADSLADRSVTRAGWFLFGPSYNYGTITIVTAMASVDGMCRPNQYNGFVFVSNRFAGTLSPTPTDSRSDGALGDINFYDPDNLTVEFSRYTDDDALCCPSRTSRVTYNITTGTRGLLKAEDVDTIVVCRDGGGPIQTQDNVISGTVTYRMQPRVLPPTAVLTVSLLDVSRADAPSTPIAQERIETAGKLLPFSFGFAYDRTKIQSEAATRSALRSATGTPVCLRPTRAIRLLHRAIQNRRVTVVPVGAVRGRPNRSDNRESTTLPIVNESIGAEIGSDRQTCRLATPDGTPVSMKVVFCGLFLLWECFPNDGNR